MKSAGERCLGVPVMGAAAEVAVAEVDGVLKVLVVEGVELDGPEGQVEEAGVEVALALVGGEFGGGFDDAWNEAFLPGGRDGVGAGVEVVFGGVVAGAGLACGRAGAGGLFGIGTVGGEALFGHADKRHIRISGTSVARGGKDFRGDFG
ncbi:MAG TPA: hypothetical protein VGK29_10885 [Paludibaculum sp.]|jgi:hypothetical protein